MNMNTLKPSSASIKEEQRNELLQSFAQEDKVLDKNLIHVSLEIKTACLFNHCRNYRGVHHWFFSSLITI